MTGDAASLSLAETRKLAPSETVLPDFLNRPQLDERTVAASTNVHVDSSDATQRQVVLSHSSRCYFSEEI